MGRQVATMTRKQFTKHMADLLKLTDDEKRQLRNARKRDRRKLRMSRKKSRGWA